MPWDMEDATRRWIDGSGDRTKRRFEHVARAPWDEQQWFDLPVMNEFTNANPVGLVTSIAKANPRRVVLILGCASGTGLYVSIRPDVGAATNGYQLLATTLPLIITQASHGNLAQVEWFAFIPQFDVLDVIEVFLRDWP